jgi:hypothetical protein
MTISKIQKNRIQKYKDLSEKDSETRVYSSKNNDDFGYVIDKAPDYNGEAGRSSRVRVLWSDGKTTLCCLKGMSSFNGIHHKIN